MNEVRWRKSTHSGDKEGECVEVGLSVGSSPVGVRDTKDREGGQLTVPAEAWTGFLNAVK